MSKQRKLRVLSFFAGTLVMVAFSQAFAGMTILLKDGRSVTVPVNREDVVSITFEQAGQARLLETLIVPNDKPVKVKSSAVLQKGQWYVIEAGGVISDWSHVNDGVDAVWCYGEWRCGRSGEVWNQLRIDDKGMTDIAGKLLPYNPQHVYRVRYRGEGRPVELYCSDAQGSWGDNSGAFTVNIFQE